jgi:mRNA interferase RelE/StbE
MTYSLKLHRNVEKQLARIPRKFRSRVVKSMRDLRDKPRPHGCVKLDHNLYRIRIGQYRVIYAVFDEELIIFVCKAGRRTEDTYRELRTLLDRAIDEVKDNDTG